MKLFITGHAGFIGSAIIRNLGDIPYDGYDYAVNSADDINDTDHLSYQLGVSQPDIIINMAGEIAVDKSNQEPFKYYQNNTLGFASVLRAARKFNIPVVQASTSQVSQWSDNHYLNSKNAAERIAETENTFSNLGISIVRITNPYGTGQPNNFVIPKFIELAKAGSHVQINNEGKSLKDFIWVDDVATGILAAAKELYRFPQMVHTAFLGTTRRTNIKNLAKMIFEMVGSKLLYEEVGIRTRDGDTPEINWEDFPPDWEPQVSLEEGIRRLL